MNKIIFIDLDGTLTPQSTWFTLNMRLGITEEEDKALFEQYLKDVLKYDDWYKELIRIHKTRGSITKREIEDFAQAVELRPDALSTVQALFGKGYHVVLLSGSVDLVVEIMAKKLGINNWFACSKFIFDNEGYLTDLISLGDEAPAKLKLAEKYANEEGINLSDCFSIDDGGNGVELFSKTKGIVLGSNEKLLPLAWKQVQSLSEIPDVLP